MMTSLYDPGPSAPSVPRLTELCKRVLKANVSHLVDVGDVPYEMVRETLFGCRVDQLREIEALSPHIADDDEGMSLHRIIHPEMLADVCTFRNLANVLQA